MQGGSRGAVLVVIALSTLQVVLAMMLPAQRLLAQSCEVELTESRFEYLG